MSILIRSMAMPKNCAECKMWCICECLNDFEDFESICYAVEDGDLIRDKNCPLVEIKEPHGRLIDIKSVKNGKFTIVEDAYQAWWNGVLEAVIENAPTVIEAEGENI